MLLSLLSPALALTIPVTAKISDELNNNGTEGFRQTVTGTVAVSNPATGAVFRVGTEELTVNRREGSGGGAVSFSGDPAGTLRTWALYYLDANGRVLGDPEVVEMLFDDSGNGALAGRGNGDIMAILIRRGREMGVPSFTDLRSAVQVQDGAVDATLVGIMELTHEGPALNTDADMTLLDVDTFAAFQELGLDAVMAIDSRSTTLQADITVSGLSVASDGTVEGGGELRWDVTLYDPTVITCPSRICDAPTLLPIASVSYLDTVGAVKKKSGQPPAVKLQPADVTYDSWELGVGLLLPGDMRDLEISASLDFLGVAGSDIVTLDPGWIGVTWEADTCGQGRHWHGSEGIGCHSDPIVDIFQDGDCDDCGDYDFVNPEDPPDWVFLADELFEIEVLDSAGGFIASHLCTMSPTAATLAGTNDDDVLVGECTRDTAGTEVRRLRAIISEGTVEFSVEMGGAAFTAERSGWACSKEFGCTDSTVTVLGGSIVLLNDGEELQDTAIAVTEAEFALPFSFTEDVAGLTGELVIEFDDPTYDLTWVTTDEAYLGYYGDRLMRTIAFADMDLVTDNRELRCSALGVVTPSRLPDARCTTAR